MTRAALLKDEQELVDKVKAVAAKRRQLPPGGQLKKDYVFQWASDGKVGERVKFSELFGDKNTLLLYSFMYGQHAKRTRIPRSLYSRGKTNSVAPNWHRNSTGLQAFNAIQKVDSAPQLSSPSPLVQLKPWCTSIGFQGISGFAGEFLNVGGLVLVSCDAHQCRAPWYHPDRSGHWPNSSYRVL